MNYVQIFIIWMFNTLILIMFHSEGNKFNSIFKKERKKERREKTVQNLVTKNIRKGIFIYLKWSLKIPYP